MGSYTPPRNSVKPQAAIMRAGPLFVWFMALVLVSGCSSFFQAPTLSLKLPEGGADSWRFELVSSNPYLYRKTPGDGRTQLFLTGIKDCSFNRRTSSATAARQLLVGLHDIRIRSRQSVSVATRPLLRTLIEAKLDTQPLEIADYTYKTNGCVYDYVLWADAPGAGLMELNRVGPQLDGFESYLAQILKDIAPSAEDKEAPAEDVNAGKND